jgi:hypothetical protein
MEKKCRKKLIWTQTRTRIRKIKNFLWVVFVRREVSVFIIFPTTRRLGETERDV